MTNILNIYGTSDDLVQFEGAIREEFDSYDKPWVGKLEAPDGSGMMISAVYGGKGTWMIGAGPLDEKVTMPAWPLTLTNSGHCFYSAGLTLEVPDGVTITEF
tara:strand:+ start:2153 stop:2458 length:306 start_codon:yes stop_codon:yes gene_type:complete